MPEFVFAYHGGKTPESDAEREEVMNAWREWMGGMGEDLVQPGAPVGPSRTVSGSGIADDGGANTLAGFSIVRADSHDKAVEMAKGCPMVVSGSGSVEVAEILPM